MPSPKMASMWTVVSILAVGLILSIPLDAQVVGATLSGTVADESGAVNPNATVSITHTETGVIRQVKTNRAGFYTVPNLLPGTYKVTATSAGFSTAIQSGIVLTVGGQQVLNFTLRIGTATEKIDVSASAPTVQLATSSISAVVDSTTVRTLPLNGRSWTDLATLQPGVNAIETQIPFSAGPTRGLRGFGAQISVAGARPQDNNYRLDGISINDYSNGAPGSVLGGNLGVDAIQEFSVLTSTASAEYGRTAGGVVNAITRSGTNQFHGAAYEFFRNNALDARNYFDTSNPPFHRNQFGVDAGGPIRKDKLFIFGDYEGIRQSKGITTIDTVPSTAARNGLLCSAPSSAACAPHGITVDPSVLKYLPFWPNPNKGIKAGSNGDIGIFAFAGQQIVTENYFTTRLDDKISSKDSLAATYVGDITPYTSPDGLDAVQVESRSNRQIATLEDTLVASPSLVNVARMGYSREFVINAGNTSAISPLAHDHSLAAIPGQFAAAVNVSGLTSFTGGVNGNSHHIDTWNSFQVYDDLFWIHGTQSLKLGGAVERMQLNSNATHDPSGNFTFSTLSNFLTNKPKKVIAGLPTTAESPRRIRQSLFALYCQDDWRARPNLTINLGLRWEMTTVPTETQGKLSNLLNITDATPHLGSPFFSNPSLHNFEPRLGFAWDPFRNGKTAIRGGAAMFDVLDLPYQFYIMIDQAYPFSVEGSATNLPQGTFFAGAQPLLTALGTTADTIAYVPQHPHRSYVAQWNLNVQRELGWNVTALLGYVGYRGVHEPVRLDDADIVLPKLTSAGYLFPSPVGSGTRINPNWGSIRTMLYEGESSYNGLELSLQRNMSHGVQIHGSFTWSKSIDTGSATVAGDQFSNSISSLPWYDLKSARGLSDFNVGRTLVISTTWQVPSVKSFSGARDWIASGWELGAIFKARGGIPFTPTFGTDGDPQGLNSGDPWDFPNRLTGPGCTSLVNPGNPNNYIKTECFAIPTAPSLAFWNANCDPAFGTPENLQCFNLRGNAGRNILTGPGLMNLDFSIFKNNHIRRLSDNFNVQFRAEFFNILNHPNFALPVTPNNTDIFDSTGARNGVAGFLTSTTTTAREIQFALKVVW
jgi:hypothetical protein